MRMIRQITTVNEQGREAVTQDIVPANSMKKGRGFGLFPLSYFVGCVVGVIFPLWANVFFGQAELFFTAYLDNFASAQDVSQLLGRHLAAQLMPFVLLLVSAYSIWGLPLLLLCCAGKGLLNGATYTCVLTGIFAIEPTSFILCYVIFELGSTAAMFAMLWVLLPINRSLCRSFFRQKSVIHISTAKCIEQLCCVGSAYFIWCLLARLFSQSLFPSGV